MKTRLSIDLLHVGMFIEAEVQNLLVDGEIRHYLEPSEATVETPSTKRLRLTQRKCEQVTQEGGMLVTSNKQIDALRQIGLSEIVINTEKSDVIPDPEERPPEIRRKSAPPEPLAELGPDMVPIEELSLELLTFSHREEEAGDEPAPGRRRNFGPSGTGWMKVEVEAEGRQAFLQVLSFGGDRSLGAEEVFRALEELYGIRAGVDRKMVGNLVAQAAVSPHRVLRGRFLIARSTQPVPGKIGRIDYTFMEAIPADAQLPYAQLREALSRETLPEVLTRDLPVRLVLPGEELAVFVPAADGPSAQNIFGAARSVAGAQALLKTGPHVRLEGSHYLSEIYGYVCLLDDEISVIPPLWISPDCMEAHFVRFPRVGPGAELTWEWLAELLERQNVRFGLREAAIQELLAIPSEDGETASYPIASGRPPERGEDARIVYAFAAEDGNEEPRPDGSIDLRARYAAATVKSGQLLAEVTPATGGQPGVDLADRTVPGIPGKQQELSPGIHVRCERQGDVRRFFAEIDGRVKIDDGTFKVFGVTRIAGNVDAPLEFTEAGRELYIAGSVRSGAAIKCAGNMVVEGVVETDASIHARGDVVVARGIVGRQTRVFALGKVETRFVQHGSVVAGGDVTVTSYLLNARVRAGGRLVVQANGGERGGSIAGGETYATTGIAATRLGAATADTTQIGIGPDPQIVAQLRKLDQGLDFYRTNVLRIFRTLGISEIDAAHFKRLIEQTPPAERKPLVRVLTQLKELVEAREKSLKTRKSLEQKQAQTLEKASIHIAGTVFADAQIRMGEAALTLAEDLQGPVFTWSPREIRWRVGE